MREYSPKRRTALVLAGSGTAGAYHAGVLKALDENGVKVDLVVGSGAGTVAAAFAALAAGERLAAPGGFWEDAGWDGFYALRPALRLMTLLLAASFGVFLLPLAAALLLGIALPILLLVDLAIPIWSTAVLERLLALATALRIPYLAALALPVFLFAVAALAWAAVTAGRDRRRLVEAFESPMSLRPAADRVHRCLAELVRASGGPAAAASPEEVGRRYLGTLFDNLGQPGFRELVLCAADLEASAPISFVALREPHRGRYLALRSRSGSAAACDLAGPGAEHLLVPAVVSGVALPPPLGPPVRVVLPRGGARRGETHRLTDAAVAGACGLSEALLAGAEQVVVACPVPETPSGSARRRGPRAAAEGLLCALERQALERELAGAERISRMVETLGHHSEGGGRAWQDPASGRIYRDVALYVIRPERRLLGPLDFDGVQDAARDVAAMPEDLLDLGYRDAHRLFLEPVLGASAEPAPRGEPERQAIGL